MKINITFNMNDEGDAADFQDVIHLGELRQIKEELYAYARSLRKYEERDSIPTKEVSDKLFEILALYTGDV